MKTLSKNPSLASASRPFSSQGGRMLAFQSVRLSTLSLIVALVGLGIAGYGVMNGLEHHDSRPLVSWLIGVSFWLSVGLGMLFIVMLWHVFHATWPIIVRRQLEHGFAGFKWLALAFAPLVLIALFGGEHRGILWEWMSLDATVPGGGTVGEDPLYRSKEAYLNVPFFAIRTVIYFGVFIGLGYLLRRASFLMDKDGDPKRYRTMMVVSAAGLPLLFLAVTFAAIDWFKSLEYHWFSTMYGVWFFSASVRAGLAVSVIICFYLSMRGRALDGLYRDAHRCDFGCLCLAFTMFWAYISFSQYFLIYNANIPEETFWFNIREKGLSGLNSWWWVGIAQVFCGFLFPFLFLLWYKNKVMSQRLLFIAVWILLFHLLDIYWNVLPSKVVDTTNIVGYTVRQFSITAYDVAAILGVGGLWMWAFIRSSRKTAPIPIRDPRIRDSIEYEGH